MKTSGTRHKNLQGEYTARTRGLSSLPDKPWAIDVGGPVLVM